jgi:alpha-D-ribose 1-methylphosphonate 5-triphosphate synthase subunit PhnG
MSKGTAKGDGMSETSGSKANADRRAFMAILAAAHAEEITTALQRVAADVAFSQLRRPETGLVMLRGRMGGSGSAFNFGEATVTRANVRLESGETGFACILGRDPVKAKAAALADALWQRAEFNQHLHAEITVPVQRRLEREARIKAEETAATKVNFFTMVRGDD